MREAVESSLPSWSEVILEEANVHSFPESVAEGGSVIVVPDFASASECASLWEVASTKATQVEEGRAGSQQLGQLSMSLACRLEHSHLPTLTPGRVRMPIAGLGVSTRTLCDELLLRALDFVEQEIPSLASDLFGETSLAGEVRASGQPVYCSSSLTFTHLEPAINVYRSGGDFEPHRDLQALTLLVPLASADSFTGGGTAFYSRAGGATAISDHESARPAVVITPPAGTALLFGGEVTHAALAVTSGERAVLVASFSRRAVATSGDKDGAAATDADLTSSSVGATMGTTAVGDDELQAREHKMLRQMYGEDQ